MLLRIHEHEAACIPDLVGKVSGSLHLFRGIAGIVSGADTHQQGEAQCVSAILINHFQRVNTIAQRLGHFSSQLITDKAMNQHGFKRSLAHLLNA